MKRRLTVLSTITGYSIVSEYDFQDNVRRGIIEEFNIRPEIEFELRVIANSPLFRSIAIKIYKMLTDERLGNVTKAITSKGDHYGTEYVVPFMEISRKLDIKGWLDSIDKNLLKAYAEWYILRAHNPNVPSTLYEPLGVIGSNSQDLDNMMEELVKQRITSKLIKNGPNTMAIYDEKRFNDFCEMKMNSLLERIIDDE